MKHIQIIVLFSLLIAFGCNSKNEMTNKFTSLNDTLIIQTVRLIGIGILPAGAGQISFKDTNERYSYPVIFPRNIQKIKLAWKHIDIKPFEYEYYKKGKFPKKEILKYVDEKKIDTLNLPSLKDNSIAIMSGIRGRDTIFIVDENNNKDFRDDSVRLYQKMQWRNTSNLIKCKYKIYNGKGFETDSTWLNIGYLDQNELLFFVSHHINASFSIDKQNYQIDLVDKQSNFCFDEPIIALKYSNETVKDTLFKKDLINKGEYAKLNDTYYRFENISNDGKKMILIKEKDFNSKIGTQVGMKAPTFRCRTIDGEILESNKIIDKPIIIANISGCTPKSYGFYRKLIEKHKELYIIGVESGIHEKLGGKMVDVENNFNKTFYNDYRKAYSNYDCYLIDKNGRITEKFQIFDWEKILIQETYD